MDEKWRPVVGYERTYQVSSVGQVRRIIRRRPKAPLSRRVTKRGYLGVQLHQNGVGKNFDVHILVALAFLGPRPEGKEVRHLDGNPLNPELSNLTYGSKSENELDKVRHGTHHNARKTHCPKGHPYDEANTYRPPSKPNSRDCRACTTERARAKRVA